MKGLHVFREARSSVSDAGIQELWSDSRVGSDARANFLDVCAGAFRNIGDRIDERYFHRQERVGCMFDEFRALRIGDDDRCPRVRISGERNCVLLFVVTARGQWPVDRRQQGSAEVVVDSHDDPVRIQKIGDRRALAQEFWIRSHGERSRRSAAQEQRPSQGFASAYRHGAFLDDYLRAPNRGSNFVGHRFHERQVSLSRL